jgi:hypothetical protein
VPSATFLDALGEDASAEATPAGQSAVAPSAPAASDGSLGIGSLKGEMDP